MQCWTFPELHLTYDLLVSDSLAMQHRRPSSTCLREVDEVKVDSVADLRTHVLRRRHGHLRSDLTLSLD